jgi:lipopolysaccharide transport system ATP-binding protein
MPPVISVEHLSKTYRLGQIGTGTFSRDLEVWWAQVRGKPNPLLKIGEKDHGNRDGEELYALRDVSFTVEQGEVLGIIGKNGAGKSTLLKILSRVTAPTSGKIKVKGRIASLLEVGTGFHPELTGRENTYLNGAIFGMSHKEVERKFDEIVDFAEIEKFIDTPVKRYSSGMYVRLAFAVAAHLDPEILVVDEVLAVGDAEFQKKCLGKMGDVAKGGRTVLFVSHNMAAVESLCSTGLLLAHGFTQFTGRISNVISQYAGAYQPSAIVNDFSHCHRTGNRKAIIDSIRLENEQGILCASFAMGEEIKVIIDVEFLEDAINPSAGVYIFADNGVQVSDYRTHQTGIQLGKLRGRTTFILVIKSMLLYPRNYVFSIWISNQTLDDDYDFIRDAIAFEVRASATFMKGKNPTAQYGYVHLPFEWKVISP